MRAVRAPECAYINDGPGFDRRFVGPTITKANEVEGINGTTAFVGELMLTWSGFSDYFSGIAGYAVGMVPSATFERTNDTNMVLVDAQLVDVGLVGSFIFVRELVHNERYHGVVRVWDGLYNSRTCFSNGVRFDASPPNVSLASLTSHLATAPNNVQRVSHMVHAEVRGVFDDESGVRHYLAAVGAPGGNGEEHAAFRSIGASEGELVIGGLNMADGNVTVSVRAVNNAKESSDVVLTIGVDTQPPACAPIALWNDPPGKKFTYTEENSSLVATWNCTDASPWTHVPIQCDWSISTFPGGSDLMPWTVSEPMGTHEFSCNDCFRNGRLYFVNVRCVDQVGLTTMTTSGGRNEHAARTRGQTDYLTN